MQGHAEELRGIQENTGVCRGMQWDAMGCIALLVKAINRFFF